MTLRILLALPLLVAGVNLSPADAGSWHAVETLAGHTTVPLQIAGNTRAYFRVAPGQPLPLSVTGPAQLQLVTRAALPAGRAHATYKLRVTEGGRNVGQLAAQAPGSGQARDAHGAVLTRSRRLAVELPAGPHALSIAVDGESEVFVRIRTSGPHARAAGPALVTLTPLDASRSVLLAEGEKTIPYFTLTGHAPVRLRVVGPTSLDLTTRLDFDSTMRGTLGYRIAVDEGGRRLRELAFQTTKATTATYTNVHDVVPSKLDHAVLSLGPGTHELVLTLLEPAKGSAAVHARIPAPNVGNEE